ncbi:hypothetical protein COB57_00420 [Candidatus Peregrinibacteria bacterium]|nr:MAG: hypothetical protein COB57_00420 [Candidatus Peregrinibacteria bacterium]
MTTAQKFLLVSHRNPDGDTLGSTTGLYQLLTKRGKKCDIACTDTAPPQLSFLPHTENIIHEFNIKDYDAIIICDAAARDMAGFNDIYPELYNGTSGLPVLNIDHHPTNDNYGTINIVRTEAASTTVILTQIFMKMGWEIPASAATCFLTGIYTDTGSFMHSNTDPLTLKTASYLMKKGANLSLIRKKIFKTTNISTLKLWGRVLENTFQDRRGVIMSVVTHKDFSETGAGPTDLTGVVDYVNSVPNSKFSILLTEKAGGQVKASLRTLKNDVDVSEIASRFGGGGHKKAAGFTIPGQLKKETKWSVIS